MAKKLGLVLGGGGIRGMAHIGVLKIIDELGIKFDAISGCSIGSMIGALYAAGKSALEIEEYVLEHSLLDVFDLSFSKLGIKKTKKLEETIEEFTGVTTFEELKMPLYINASSISTGKERVFHQGDLFTAIRASIAVPGLFAPLELEDNYFVDGGVHNLCPFPILPNYINKYLIINVSDYETFDIDDKISLLDLLETSVRIMQNEIMKLRLRSIKKSDYLILTPEVKEYRTLEDKKKFPEILKEGEVEANKRIEDIKRFCKVK
jgi:NTE family protein